MTTTKKRKGDTAKRKSPSGAARKRKTSKRAARLTARTADRHVLYTEAVQSPESEIAFFSRVYRKANGCDPKTVREDFCGTAKISCDWVSKNRQNIAIGVDLDEPTLAWSREHYVQHLTADQQKRLTFKRANVLTVKTPPVDVVAALNFSFCVFKQRAELVTYFRQVRKALRSGGVFVLDIYGGPDSQKPAEESTKYKNFTYVWDQAEYNPITNEALNHIHFLFPDGSRMMKAFTYDWRLWTPAELTEALAEAGFSDACVYWEDSDADGDGNGVYRVRAKPEVEDAWVAYVVGFR